MTYDENERDAEMVDHTYSNAGGTGCTILVIGSTQTLDGVGGLAGIILRAHCMAFFDDQGDIEFWHE